MNEGIANAIRTNAKMRANSAVRREVPLLMLLSPPPLDDLTVWFFALDVDDVADVGIYRLGK